MDTEQLHHRLTHELLSSVEPQDFTEPHLSDQAPYDDCDWDESEYTEEFLLNDILVSSKDVTWH